MTEDRSDQLAQERREKKWKVDYLYHKQNGEISRIMSLKSKNFKQLKNLERGVIIFPAQYWYCLSGLSEEQ